LEKILFVSGAVHSFRKKDLDILRKHFVVDVITGKLSPVRLVKSIKKILENDVIFSWFVSKRAFYFVLLSKLLDKKYILVSGGNDIAEVPEIGYTFSTFQKFIIKLTLLLSDKVLAFSNSSKKSILELAPKANVETVYVGAIDTEMFKPSVKDEDLIITVGYLMWSNIERKGLKTFVETARYLPSKKFVVIGKFEDDSVDYLKSISTPNVIFTGYLPLEQLLKYYQKAKVYVQVSAHEGFGISIAEAMACECVPVVTKKAAIPEVVGNAGYYVPFNDPKATAEAIERALKDERKGKKARERINALFTLERREKELKRIIETLTKR
jgi:glycosyltransferase involved in cell wall biosynthesis